MLKEIFLLLSFIISLPLLAIVAVKLLVAGFIATIGCLIVLGIFALALGLVNCILGIVC